MKSWIWAATMCVTSGGNLTLTALIGIDAEDWDHLTYLPNVRTRDAADSDFRAFDGFEWLTHVLEEYSISFTSFYTARCFRNLAQQNSLAGEPAVHCHNHIRPVELSREQFELELDTMLGLMSDCGVNPKGYRAPCFALSDHQFGAVRSRFDYSSSVLNCSWHKNYHGYDLSKFTEISAGVFRDDSFIEFTVPTQNLFGVNIPFSGGGYFRLLPLSITKLLIRQFRGATRGVVLPFYFHPYEFSRENFDYPAGLNGWRMRVGVTKNRDKLRYFLDSMKSSSDVNFLTYGDLHHQLTAQSV